jgi:hypothetical protein
MRTLLAAAIASAAFGAAASAASEAPEELRVPLQARPGGAGGEVVFRRRPGALTAFVEVSIRGAPRFWDRRYEVVLRPGTCARPGLGRGYNLAGAILERLGGAPAFDELGRTTWAVEAFDSEWHRRGLRQPWSACGEHFGEGPLATFAAPAPARQARRRRAAAKLLVTAVDGARTVGTFSLAPLVGGARTDVRVDYPGRGSGPTVGRLRPGTCRTLLAAREFPFRHLPGDPESSANPRSRLVVPVAFRRFARERFVVEFGDRWFGDSAVECVQLSPAR